MHKTRKFHQNQQGVFSDHNALQDYARETIDYLTQDGITAEPRYAGFAVVKTATTKVTVEPGRLYVEGRMYTMETPLEIDFFSQLPLATEKIVAIVASGSEVEEDVEPRKFLIDATTRATQVQTVPMTVHRAVNVSTVAGTEAASPVRPTISSGYVVLAWVRLDTAGIVSIEQHEEARLTSVQRNDYRLRDIETWQGAVGTRLDTLATDLSGLAQGLQGRADMNAVDQLAADVARLKELAELEDGYSAYGADRFLDDSQSDTTNANYLARIEEGVRFSDEAADELALQLFNPIDPNVDVTGGLLLPMHTHRRRLTVDGFEAELPVSQYAFQTVNWQLKTMSRRRIRYGQTITVCTNSRWWRSGQFDPVANVLRRDGEDWEILAGDPHHNHRWVRLRKFWEDGYDVPYWDRIVTNHSVSGAVAAQTFLNSQVGWMTRLHLYFSQVGQSGDVTILLTETRNGKPDVGKVIAQATLAQADMVQGWNEIPFQPALLLPGERYAIVLITGGNHYVGLASGTRYAQGTLFYSTDGAFYQGDLTRDLMFAIDCAEFEANRIEVEMDALSLSGGIAAIDLLADMAVPEGTSLSFEIQPGGSGAWIPIEEVKEGNSALAGLPALCKFRAVFTGTPDAHAAIRLDTSRMRISRPRTTFRHISTDVTLPAATQTLKITVLLENYYETNHDLSCTIDDVTNGASAIAPATITDEDLGVDPLGDDANHRRIRRTFQWTAAELPTPASQFKINLDGAATSALDVFHVSERVHLAF